MVKHAAKKGKAMKATTMKFKVVKTATNKNAPKKTPVKKTVARMSARGHFSSASESEQETTPKATTSKAANKNATPVQKTVRTRARSQFSPVSESEQERPMQMQRTNFCVPCEPGPSKATPREATPARRTMGPVDRNIYTVSPFFNFLREYRKKHRSTSTEGGREWHKLTEAQQATYERLNYETNFLGGPSTYTSPKPVIPKNPAPAPTRQSRRFQ